MSELDREGFERVSFRDIMFDALLEFTGGEGAASDPFELIVGQCGGE